MKLHDILSKRNLSELPLPLWKLRISDNEYAELKKELYNYYSLHYTFGGLEKEALLYYAEWWRREYNGGIPSKEQVNIC